MNDKKNKKLVHIGDILTQALGEFRPSKDTSMLQIWDIWEEAVGSPIAANAKPDAFKDGILIVNVTSSTWIHQLKFLEKEMTANLNRTLGKPVVRQIRFKIGKIFS